MLPGCDAWGYIACTGERGSSSPAGPSPARHRRRPGPRPAAAQGAAPTRPPPPPLRPAGTNFCIRAKALAACGWFPEYTITEDYALSMELKKRGFNGRCAPWRLAGQAPPGTLARPRPRRGWPARAACL